MVFGVHITARDFGHSHICWSDGGDMSIAYCTSDIFQILIGNCFGDIVQDLSLLSLAGHDFHRVNMSPL